MALTYRRYSDNAEVTASEALTAFGHVRDGYGTSNMLGPGEYARFDRAFLDASPAGRMMFHDTAMTSTLSDGGKAAVVARAEMIHRTRNAYLGDRAPAFTDAAAQLAISQAERDAGRIRANDAACAAELRDQNEAHRNQMIADIRNAWRK